MVARWAGLACSCFFLYFSCELHFVWPFNQTQFAMGDPTWGTSDHEGTMIRFTKKLFRENFWADFEGYFLKLLLSNKSRFEFK